MVPGKYFVSIHQICTGEVVIMEFKDGWDEWNWTEGNNSCDCNRHLHFKRTKDLTITETDFLFPCGDEEAYKIKVVSSDGTVVYSEEVI